MKGENGSCWQVLTSGIPGGYRLVSTYDLPHFPKCGGGVFRSKLWSSQIWSFPKWGGYSGVNFGHLKSEVFQNVGGGGFLVWNSRKGLSGKFGQKFTVQPETCLCITDSLSHVETNNSSEYPTSDKSRRKTVSADGIIRFVHWRRSGADLCAVLHAPQ